MIEKNIKPIFVQRRFLFILMGLSLITSPSFSQVVPPGMGEANAASWLAFGVQQDLDTLSNTGWSSTTYLGLGRVSDPDNNNPFHKPGIFILNQEFKNKFTENWSYSVALSYQRHREYAEISPYEALDPSIKQEFRLYGRLSYSFHLPFMTITPTYRQEFQKYFTPDFENPAKVFRIRARFRLKFAFPLTADKTQRLLLFSEQLFSSSKMNKSKKWTDFKYDDSRFAIYYSIAPPENSFIFNIGYMNNLIGTKPATSTHFLAIDVIWKNPLNL